MSEIEFTRYDTCEDLFGEDYDYDHTVIQPGPKLDAFVALLKTADAYMAVKDEDEDGKYVHHRGAWSGGVLWTLMDVRVYEDGTARAAYTGDGDMVDAVEFMSL